MNLYLVVSEPIYHVVWEDWFNQVGHREDYCIAELVVAKNRGQAKWLAWKSDKEGDTFPSIEDMPRFQIRIKAYDVAGDSRIITNDKQDWIPEDAWDLQENERHEVEPRPSLIEHRRGI